MSAVLRPQFGNPAVVRAAEAANAAFRRALSLGHSRVAAMQFSRNAKREASEWEEPTQTAMRVVLPPRGTFAGNPGGAA